MLREVPINQEHENGDVEHDPPGYRKRDVLPYPGGPDVLDVPEKPREDYREDEPHGDLQDAGTTAIEHSGDQPRENHLSDESRPTTKRGWANPRSVRASAGCSAEVGASFSGRNVHCTHCAGQINDEFL